MVIEVLLWFEFNESLELEFGFWKSWEIFIVFRFFVVKDIKFILLNMFILRLCRKFLFVRFFIWLLINGRNVVKLVIGRFCLVLVVWEFNCRNGFCGCEVFIIGFFLNVLLGYSNMVLWRFTLWFIVWLKFIL